MPGVPVAVTPYDPFLVSDSANSVRYSDLPFINVKNSPYGALLDGVTDDRGTLATADAAAVAAGVPLLIPSGTLHVGSNITVTSPVIVMPGAKISIPNGVTVTLSSQPNLPDHRPVFTLAGTGVVVFPKVWREYHAAWWGMLESATNNNVAIQAAINCAYASSANNGSVVLLPTGNFRVSSKIVMKNRVRLVGNNKRDTEIEANAATWDGSTRVIEYTNGGASMWDCSLEHLHVIGNGIAAIAALVYASCWNDGAGVAHCIFSEYASRGILCDTGDGGAAIYSITDSEFFGSSAGAGASWDIHLSNGFAAAYQKVHLARLTFTSAGGALQTSKGVHVGSRVMLVIDSLHFENHGTGIDVHDAGIVVGSGITGSPAAVTQIFEYGGTATGYISVSGVTRAGATKTLLDNKNGYTIYAAEAIHQPLTFPPDPGRAIVSAKVTGGGAPSLIYDSGVTSVSRTGVGTYRITMDVDYGGVALYHVAVQSYDTGFRISRVLNQTGGVFDIEFVDASNVLQDTSSFGVWVYHKP